LSERKKIKLSELQKKAWDGPRCRKCGCRDFRTTYTRHKEFGTVRKKICRHCGEPIRTVEKMI